MHLLLPCLVVSMFIISSAVAGCVQSCGSHRVGFPFGFSPDCKIPLNCSADSSLIRIVHFPVKNITSDRIFLDVAPLCNRSVSQTKALYGNNYAVTAKNTFLLSNCSNSKRLSSCVDPSKKFLIANCNDQKAYDVSCLYSNSSQKDGFLMQEKVTSSGCSIFYSSMPYHADNASVPSINIGIVELEWWVEGGCDQCSDNTQCRLTFSPVTGRESVTCKCNSGFFGDGFSAGSGCLEVAHRCSPSKYVSGECSARSRVGILIGGIIVGAVVMAGIALVCCLVKRRRTFLQSRKSTRRLLSEASCAVPHYNYREIERATDCFSDKNRIGTGAYGNVYFGRLQNGEFVAVKKLKNNDNESIEQVMNEVKLLSSVSHPNLVRLLGCCIERGEQVLVYEFMPNGTLAQHLQRERETVLSWTIRLNIVTDTAKAIAHLHSAIHPPIYHRDIKSSNILVDYNFNSKVADFGLSRMVVTDFSHVSTAPQGTPGYLDPQYHQNFHLSDKSDVYSFGVVLIEVITAQKVVDFSRGQSEVNLAALAIDKIGKGRVEDIIDPYLEPHRDTWTMSSIHKVAELAFRCLAFHRDMRPSMTEVASELEQIRHAGWAPGNTDMLLSATSSLRSSPSNMTDKSRGTSKSRKLLCLTSFEGNDDSPVSVQDPWRSEQSSPSANSLLGGVVR